MSAAADLDPEDAKIVTLARSARARTGAAEGAAVRDTDGRTYVAATVALPSLQLTALQAAVAAAVSSGAPGLEAAAVVTAADAVDAASLAAVRDLAPDGARPARRRDRRRAAVADHRRHRDAPRGTTSSWSAAASSAWPPRTPWPAPAARSPSSSASRGSRRTRPAATPTSSTPGSTTRPAA